MTIKNIKEINIEEIKHAFGIHFEDPNCSVLDIENSLNQCGNLHYLSITHPTLVRLPSNLLALSLLYSVRFTLPKLKVLEGHLLSENLTDLHIQSSSLTQISDVAIGHLSRLQSLAIHAPITKMSSLAHLQNLHHFDLAASDIKDLSEKTCFPKSLTQLIVLGNKLLKTIDLVELQPLTWLQTDTQVSNISVCKNLQDLRLKSISALPEGLETCQALTSISIMGGNLSELPDWFMQLTQLRSLRMENTPLKKVPQDWSVMKNLESLSLYNNQIEDFSFAYTIPNLKSLNLNGNPIKDKLFFLEGTKILPVDSYQIGDLFHFKPLPHKETLSFMSALAKSGMSRTDKEWFFDTFKDMKTIEITEGWSFYRLVQGLFVPFKLLLDKITIELQKRDVNKQGLETFKNVATCFLDGSFAENKNEIKDKLKSLGINVSSQLNDTVTHIIFGKKPKESLCFYENNELAYLLEHQLYAFIKDVGQEDKFLVQEAAAGESVMADSLKQLLASTDANMVQIGLEMLKTGGVTEGVFDELLLLNKTFNDAKVRAETKKILISQGSSEWIGVLNDRQTFVDIQNARGKEIRDKLEKMAKSVDKSAVFAFAMLLFKYHQKGLPFVLANFGTNSDERKAALLALTDRTYFDFHTGVGYHNWKNKRPEEVILSPVKTGIAFPIDHPKAKEIRVINMHNCKFDTLSKDITVFENLEELDLSVNNLKSLPIQIGKLTKLKKLDLSFNRLTAFPAALENLSQLEYLDLRHNDANAFKSNLPTAIEIPQTFANKLPNCVVLL